VPSKTFLKFTFWILLILYRSILRFSRNELSLGRERERELQERERELFVSAADFAEFTVNITTELKFEYLVNGLTRLVSLLLTVNYPAASSSPFKPLAALACFAPLFLFKSTTPARWRAIVRLI
jgi:hypothetical protein